MWRPGKLRFLIGVKNPLPIRPTATARKHLAWGHNRDHGQLRLRHRTRAAAAARHDHAEHDLAGKGLDHTAPWPTHCPDQKRPIGPVSRFSSSPRSSRTSSGSRPASREISAMVRLARSAFSGFTGTAIMTRCQFPWNTVPGLGFRRSARNRSRKLGSPNTVYQLLAVMGLDRVERRMAVEGVGARQSEIERQRLTGDLDIELIAARLGRGA